MKRRLTEDRRAALEQRYFTLRAAMEPGKVGNIVDGVSPEDADIEKTVEKIMSLMQAEDGAGKYHTAAKVYDIVKKAFGEHEHESPVEEAADLHDPVLHPVEDLEHEVQTMDDDKLSHEVEQLESDMKHKLHSETPELSPEHKMALLMNLPAQKRLAKAANLRALADALDADMREVSNENAGTDKANASLANDYENQEAGSMEDVKASVKKTLKQLIAASEDMDMEKEDAKEVKEDEKEMDKEAVLKLALKHLLASIEDTEEKTEPETKEEKDDEKEDAETPEEEEKGDEPSFEERKAILKARLASLKKSANVDGKNMKTPKDVPNPAGTTEDQLKGDAKIQYSTATGESGLGEIHERREKIPNDKMTAGADEPNEVYQANHPVGNHEVQTESDSAKDVNNKRSLKDEGVAVQKAEPAPPSENMELGAGSHQKAKDWEKAKSESDVTPSGDRLVGLADMKTRIERAHKLAAEMTQRGLITSEAQLTEQVIKFASMDDNEFKTIAAFVESTAPKAKTTKKAEFEPFEKKEDKEDEPKDEKEDEEHEDEPAVKEAAAIRRVAAHRNSDSRSIHKEGLGIRTALQLSGNVEDSPNSRIASKLRGLEWTNTEAEMNKRASLDQRFSGGSSPII